jgi:hypothetical protein
MEAFEHVVKVYLEARGYIVTSGVKFPVRQRTRKKRETGEFQTHGYEVDIVAAKHGSLILGSVKSFFGSSGVSRQGFMGIADESRSTHFPRYLIFNNPEIRHGIVEGAQRRYGFPLDQIGIQLFVGKFRKPDEQMIRDHLRALCAGSVQIEVVGLAEIVRELMKLAGSKTYINDPVIVTLKVLKAAGILKGC